MRRRIFLAAAFAAACGLGLIAVGQALTSAGSGTEGPIATAPLDPHGRLASPDGTASARLLAFTRTPRRPGNLLERVGVVGRSATAGRSACASSAIPVSPPGC